MFVVGRLAPELIVGIFALDAMGIDVVGLLDEALLDVPVIADLGLNRAQLSDHRSPRDGGRGISVDADTDADADADADEA